MFHRLCGSPSIPLSFTLACVLPRRDTYRVGFGTAGSIPATPSIHRLRPGLLGYLIPFATLAFVPQCQLRPSKALTPPMFLLISTHFTATPGIPFTSTAFKLASIQCRTEVEPLAFNTRLNVPPTNSLRPMIPDNACIPVLPRLLARS